MTGWLHVCPVLKQSWGLLPAMAGCQSAVHFLSAARSSQQPGRVKFRTRSKRVHVNTPLQCLNGASKQHLQPSPAQRWYGEQEDKEIYFNPDWKCSFVEVQSESSVDMPFFDTGEFGKGILSLPPNGLHSSAGRTATTNTSEPLSFVTHLPKTSSSIWRMQADLG